MELIAIDAFAEDQTPKVLQAKLQMSIYNLRPLALYSLLPPLRLSASAVQNGSPLRVSVTLW